MKYTNNTLKYMHAQTQQLESVIIANQHTGALEVLLLENADKWYKSADGYIGLESVTSNGNSCTLEFLDSVP